MDNILQNSNPDKINFHRSGKLKELKDRVRTGCAVILCLILFFCGSAVKEKSTDPADRMREFVVRISQYAKHIRQDFIIIPQNGVELAFNNTELKDGFHGEYLAAIDGMGVEELFYNGSLNPSNSVSDRLSMLQLLKKSKKILVSEFVSEGKNIPGAISRNHREEFICFVRDKANYHYLKIPDSVCFKNNSDITRLSKAQNFLYLISTDSYTSRQEMINAIAATDFDVIITDLFFNEEQFTAGEIEQLKVKANGARRLVIAYINIGSAEKFRYYWKKDWKLRSPQWIRKKYPGYKDEYLVEYWNQEWQNIIYGNDNSYMKKILDTGFDGAWLDNVETYYFLYNKK